VNTLDDDMIETLLRREFDGPVPDDGFSERVMRRLPPRRRRRWPQWSGILLGGAACALCLADAPWLQAGWRDWRAGELSAPLLGTWLLMLALAWLAAGWGLAERAER